MWIDATLRSLAAPAIAIVLAIILQLFIKPMLGEFYAKVLLDIGTNVILAVSLTMVNGFTGQFSMGHAAFMAIGGYIAAGLVYYGSANVFGTQDFGNARAQAGVLSTMLTTREVDVAGGTLVVDVINDVPGSTLPQADFVSDEDVTLLPGRVYRLRASEDSDQIGPSIPLLTAPGDHPAGTRLEIGSGASLGTSDVRLMLEPRFFSTGDVIFFFSLLAGGVGAAMCGYLVGLPSLRLRGDYLAIVTLGFGEIVRVLIQAKTGPVIHNVDKIKDSSLGTLATSLGGSLGFSKLPSYTSLFWVAFFAAMTLIVAFRLKLSSFGRAFLSIREDEIAAEAMGVNTTRFKVRAFVISAFFAGVAGGLFAHTSGVQLNAGELGFQKSFDIIILVVLGGLGSISGATIAAILLTILPELLRDPPSIWPYGLVGAVVLATAMSVFSRNKYKPFLLVGGLCAGWELLRFGAQAANVNLSEYRMVLYALVLILMMILRPQGLMGVGEIWDIRLRGKTHGSRKTGKGAR